MNSLAVKYRPKRLEQLIGQQQLVDILRGMLERGAINQTLMVHGPWGCGKTTAARLIARYLNCQSKDRKAAEPPCGDCVPCRHMTDYREINAAESRGIDAVRAVIEQAAFKPSANYRVFVLDEAHQLTPQAVQALLKITEEPPPSTVFILCTTEPQRFPEALASRCLKLLVQRIPDDKIVRLLRRIVRAEALAQETFSDELLRAIAIAVDGHARDAITVLEAVINTAGSQQIDNPEEFALKLADRVIGETPERLAVEALLSVYRGRFTPVVRALERVQNYQAFGDYLLRFHEQAMRYRFSESLRQPGYDAWYRRLEETFPDREKLPHRPLVATLNDVVDVVGRLRDGSPAYQLLLGGLLRATDRFGDD